MSRARSRDRRVYLLSHPILFALLAATRHRPVVRLGSTLLIHDPDAYLAALTRVPLNRTAAGTTGGAAGRLAGDGVLFDQQGDAHRLRRRTVSDHLSSAGVARLRPIWTDLLHNRLSESPDEIDLVPLAAEIAGATAAAMLELAVDPLELAGAARAAASTAARAHPPRLRPRWPSQLRSRFPSRSTDVTTDRVVDGTADRADRAAEAAAAHLLDLVTGDDPANAPLAAMLAVAAINTTVAALPRAVAWACDAGLWPAAETHPELLADELLRVTAPTPLLPRVAAADARLPAALRPGAHSPGALQPGTHPPGALQPGAHPPGAHPPGAHPPGAHPPGAGTPGAGTPGHQSPNAAGVPSPNAIGSRVSPTEGGCPVRAGDRMLLIARHAADAHRRDPDPFDPVPARQSRLVFGAGPHACPGAHLARIQLIDLLTALAPYRPAVLRARVDRHSALPSWAVLTVGAGR